jgi:signal transduction histidine kinase
MNLFKIRKRMTSIVRRSVSTQLPPIPQGFPILRQLEWTILALTVIMGGFSAFILSSSSEMTGLIVLSVIVLGVMRLQKFPQTLSHKILFTSAEFAIVLLPPLIDQRLRIIPPLMLMIVVRGCQMFNLPGRLLVAGFAFTSTVLTMRDRAVPTPCLSSGQSLEMTAMIQFTGVTSLGMALIFVLLLINALLDERHSRSQLASAHEQLRQYALQIENQSALQERNRIAREIHDSLGHTLTAQSIQLDSALLLLQSDHIRANTFLQASKQLCTQALQEVRHSVSALRTDPLQGKSIETAILPLIQDFGATNTISPDFSIHLSHPLPQPISAAIYRILQEALTNITRHSEATQTMIRLFEIDRKVCLVIKDNGKGFNPAQNSTGCKNEPPPLEDDLRS